MLIHCFNIVILKVDNQQLMNAFAKSSFLLYPTQYPETGCITCLKSMAMGCIPITSKFTKSNLPHLIREYDLGPTTPLNETMNEKEISNWLEKEYFPGLVRVYQQYIENKSYTDEINLHRENMIKYARKEYNWNDIALLFLKYYENIIL